MAEFFEHLYAALLFAVIFAVVGFFAGLVADPSAALGTALLSFIGGFFTFLQAM